MAEDIHQFQAGREAAIAGHPLDQRRTADWQEGWRQIMEEPRSAKGFKTLDQFLEEEGILEEVTAAARIRADKLEAEDRKAD